jgi:hypothetical protein
MAFPGNLPGVVRHYCERCAMYRDAAQIRQVGGARGMLACGVCGGALRAEQQRVSAPYAVELAKAFLFPFTPWMLATIGMTTVGATFCRFVPIFGGILAAAVIASMLFAVIRATGQGRDDLGLEEMSSDGFSSWFHPLGRYVLTILVSFAPAVLALFMLGWPEGAAVVYGLGALGALYFPAGVIVAAHNEGCVAPLMPWLGVQLIVRIPGPYFITLGFLVVGLALSAASRAVATLLLTALASVPVGPGMLAMVIVLLPLVAMARMLGLLLREHAHEL